MTQPLFDGRGNAVVVWFDNDPNAAPVSQGFYASRRAATGWLAGPRLEESDRRGGNLAVALGADGSAIALRLKGSAIEAARFVP